MKKLILCIVISGLLLLATVLILNVRAQPLASPTVSAITPNTGTADQQTDVIITGQGFIPTSTAYLNSTPLLAVTFVDSTTLEARVPFGLATGVYTLTVTNPQSGTLTNAFTVTECSVGWASGGPYGGTTHGIAIHPEITSTVYVVAELAGLFRTTDGGEQWELVIHSPVHRSDVVEVWPVSPTVVFFGGLDGLYRSEQGGDRGTWSLVDFSTYEPLNQPDALAIASSDPYTMYCAAANSVFHSSDGGVSWQKRSTGLPNAAPKQLAVDPNDATKVYAAYKEDGTIYKTSNAGQLWTQLPYTIPMGSDGQGGILALVTDPYRDDTLWLGSFNQGFYRSVDGGQIFTEVTSLHTVAYQSWFSTITFDPNQDRVYVGTIGPNDAIYYSDDNGVTWHGLSLNNQGGADIAVTPGDSDTIYTTWAGVRKSTDGGQNWTWLSEGIAGIQPQQIAVSPLDPQRVLVAAESDGAFGTHNSGNEWVTYPISRSGESHQYRVAAFDPVSPTTAYVGGTQTVFKTTDDGQSWRETGEMPLAGLPGHYDGAGPLFVAAHPQTHTTVYAGVSFRSSSEHTLNDGGLYRSHNTGDGWTRVTATGLISPVYRIVFAPADSEIIYLGTGSECHWCHGNGIWRSQDGGQTWEHPETELSGLRVLALAVHPDDPDILLAGVWSDSNDGQGIYRSTDGGDSWQLTSGLNDREELKVPDIVYDPDNPLVVYAATHGGLRVSFNGGLSWQAYPEAIGQLPITALAVSQSEEDTRIYVGTVGGTVVGQMNALRVVQEETVMGAGVYVGHSHWYLLHLPLVLRRSQ